MAKRKDMFVHCRLSEGDFERFHGHAEKLELTPSEYLRYLIRIPVDNGSGSKDVVVLDTRSVSQIHRELVRWGHHYNQGVHALNAVAFYARHGGSKYEYFVEQYEKANRNLEDVRGGERDVLTKLSALEQRTLIGGR